MALGNEQLDIFCPRKNLVVQSVSFAISSQIKFWVPRFWHTGYPALTRLVWESQVPKHAGAIWGQLACYVRMPGLANKGCDEPQLAMPKVSANRTAQNKNLGIYAQKKHKVQVVSVREFLGSTG